MCKKHAESQLGCKPGPVRTSGRPKLPAPARANFSGYSYDVLSAINIDLREESLPLAVIDTAEQ